MTLRIIEKNIDKNIKLLNFEHFSFIKYHMFINEQIIIINYINIVDSIKALKNHINTLYSLLTCVSGVDVLTLYYRFSIVYELLSIKYNNRLRVKTFINEINTVFSLTFVYRNADWWEKEIWDMFGVYFLFHPDLRRLLTDYGFEGYPLRKDFPLSGFEEVQYNVKKKIVEPTRVIVVQRTMQQSDNCWERV